MSSSLRWWLCIPLFIFACALLVGGISATPNVVPLIPAVHSARLAVPLDNSWVVAIADGKTATTAPYKPSLASADANPSTVLDMSGVSLRSGEVFTGVIVRARYVSGGAMGTDPVVCVWGRKGTAWMKLADSNGNYAITLSDTTATDCDDGTYQWTLASATIDAMGCDAVVVTLPTAAVSVSGAVRIEFTRY